MIKYFYRKTEKLSRSEQSAAAYSLLIEKLSLHFGAEFTPDEIKKDSKGCPYLDGRPDIFVSITHTDSLVACAFSDSRVGIDAEKVAIRRKSVEKRVFTDDEINLLDNSKDADLAFFTLWTLKESYLKAIGTGFADNAKSVEFLSLENPIVSNQPVYSFSTEKYGEYVISVCAKTEL